MGANDAFLIVCSHSSTMQIDFEIWDLELPAKTLSVSLRRPPNYSPSSYSLLVLVT